MFTYRPVPLRGLMRPTSSAEKKCANIDTSKNITKLACAFLNHLENSKWFAISFLPLGKFVDYFNLLVVFSAHDNGIEEVFLVLAQRPLRPMFSTRTQKQTGQLTETATKIATKNLLNNNLGYNHINRLHPRRFRGPTLYIRRLKVAWSKLTAGVVYPASK